MQLTLSRAFRLTAVLPLIGALLSGCLADTQQPLALALFDEMSRARTRLVQDGDLAQTCDQAGVVRGRLYSEVRMNLPPEPWGSLRRANDAFFAACGHLFLLRWSNDLPPEAQSRWRSGSDLHLASMCRELSQVADSLGQSRPPGCA